MPPVKPTLPSMTTILRWVRMLSQGRFQNHVSFIGMEPRHFTTGVDQRLQEALLGLARAHRVEQQTDVNSVAGALDQGIAQGGAGTVGQEDVVLQVDMLSRLCNGIEQCVVGGAAVDQQLRARGRRGRQASGGLGDLGQLDRVRPGLQTGRRRRQRGACPDAAHALALDPLWPEK